MFEQEILKNLRYVRIAAYVVVLNICSKYGLYVLCIRACDSCMVCFKIEFNSYGAACYPGSAFVGEIVLKLSSRSKIFW